MSVTTAASETEGIGAIGAVLTGFHQVLIELPSPGEIAVKTEAPTLVKANVLLIRRTTVIVAIILKRTLG